jgi:hypothetical protein
MIEKWALAIKKHEGFYPPSPQYPTGSAAYRNNNPGNFRCSGLVMGEFGATKCINNLAVFPTYEKGFAALKQFLIYAVTDKLRAYKSSMTLLDFYKVYAPSSDNNNPLNYATHVAKDLGVTVNTKIKDLADTAPAPTPAPTPVFKLVPLSQRDPRWRDVKLGFSTLTIGGYGCYITCLAMITGKTPIEVNDILRAAGCFFKDKSGQMALLDSTKAAKALGIGFLGIQYDINKEPSWMPNIKEVDMSPAPGKQQHFVVRFKDTDGKKKIIDPWTGRIQAIGFYPFVSYRLFKI